MAAVVDFTCTFHSFRLGGLIVMADDFVNQVFINKAACHKNINSILGYINPDMKSALHTSDLLCGSKGGWD